MHTNHDVECMFKFTLQEPSRPSSSSSSFSRTSPLTSPRSPQRVHSQGSKIRRSSKLEASGRRAMGGTMDSEKGEYSQLANTGQQTKFNDLAVRRNTHFREHFSSAFNEDNSESNMSKQDKNIINEPRNERHLYSSISADKVLDIDYSDYGF